jgi:hypothetical protein
VPLIIQRILGFPRLPSLCVLIEKNGVKREREMERYTGREKENKS